MTFGEWLVQVSQDLSFIVEGLPALGTTFFAHRAMYLHVPICIWMSCYELFVEATQ